jgi:class 3 adenylate cyclase
MKEKLLYLINRLADIGALPNDIQEERFSKGVLTLFVSIGAPIGIIWGILYFLLERPVSAFFPMGYGIASLLSILYYFKTKRYFFFRFSQLFLTLWLPFLVQWSLGGFVASGAVMVWAVIAPFGALLFYGVKQAIPWFFAYIFLIVVSAFTDSYFTSKVQLLPNPIIIAFFVMNIGFLSAFVFWLLQYFVRGREKMMAELDRQHKLLQIEQEKSERLLLNILPKPIADRLKSENRSIADGFSEVTVLFADIVDFTKLSSRTSPEQLVNMLNEVFSIFDELAEKHGLEKIKTIGDAYMIVGGLPLPREDHAQAIAEMALDMQDELSRFISKNGERLQVRIGINTGPVVAGVIGRKKFIYDLWGDAVNIASRMESHGLEGRIQVTEETYQKLKHLYNFENRGTIQVKGKGEMNVYILIGRKGYVNDRNVV